MLHKLVCGRCLQLFDAQLQALRFRFGRQYYCAYNLVDPHDLAWMLDALLAGEVGDVDQPLDTFLYLHECAEFGKSGDFALNYFSVWVSILDRVPGISQNLPQPQTQTRCPAID